MHLHLWNTLNRKRGYGTSFVKSTLPYYFDNLKLKKLWCEPYSSNQAPSKTLQKVGFDFVRKYKTVPDSLNFEQELNQWVLEKEKFNALRGRIPII